LGKERAKQTGARGGQGQREAYRKMSGMGSKVFCTQKKRFRQGKGGEKGTFGNEMATGERGLPEGGTFQRSQEKSRSLRCLTDNLASRKGGGGKGPRRGKRGGHFWEGGKKPRPPYKLKKKKERGTFGPRGEEFRLRKRGDSRKKKKSAQGKKGEKSAFLSEPKRLLDLAKRGSRKSGTGQS